MTRATSSTSCAPGSERESGAAAERVVAEVGLDDAGQHRDHANARKRLLQLDSQRLAERVHRRLARAVGGANRRERHPPEHRRHVGDRPLAARLQMRQHRLHAVEHRLDVVAHHGVEVLVADDGQRARDAAAGVVDPRVDVPGLGEGAVAQPLDLRAHRHVGRHGEGAAADAPDERLQLVRRARRRDDPPAAPRDLGRQRRADPLRRSRDDDDLALVTLHGAIVHQYLDRGVVISIRRAISCRARRDDEGILSVFPGGATKRCAKRAGAAGAICLGRGTSTAPQ